MTLAIHYQAIDDTKNSIPRYNFSEMYIENVRKDGIVSKFMPSQYGFTAVNMMCNHHSEPGWHEDQPRVRHNDQQHSRHLELGKMHRTVASTSLVVAKILATRTAGSFLTV